MEVERALGSSKASRDRKIRTNAGSCVVTRDNRSSTVYVADSVVILCCLFH